MIQQKTFGKTSVANKEALIQKHTEQNDQESMTNTVEIQDWLDITAGEVKSTNWKPPGQTKFSIFGFTLYPVFQMQWLISTLRS